MQQFSQMHVYVPYREVTVTDHHHRQPVRTHYWVSLISFVPHNIRHDRTRNKKTDFIEKNVIDKKYKNPAVRMRKREAIPFVSYSHKLSYFFTLYSLLIGKSARPRSV